MGRGKGVKAENNTERKEQSWLREQQDLFHLNYKVCEVGAISGGLNCKRGHCLSPLTTGDCEWGGTKELSAQDTLDRLKGKKLGTVGGWHPTAPVPAIDDKGLCLELSSGMDREIETTSLWGFLLPFEGRKGCAGSRQEGSYQTGSLFKYQPTQRVPSSLRW